VKNIISITFHLIYFFIFFSCNNNQSNHKVNNYYVIQGEAQGTTYHIKFQSSDTSGIEQALSSIFTEMDNVFSTYLEHSFISYINHQSTISNELQFNLYNQKHFLNILLQSKEIEKLTEGAFNPMVKPLVSYWGFGKERKEPDEIDSAKIADILNLIDFKNVNIICHNDSCILEISKGQQFDFNAIAQGYTVDCIADFFNQKNIDNYMIEVGGEVRTKGVNPDNKPWTIGIDKPLENNPQRVLQAKITLNNMSLATSGNYRKFYIKNGIKYAHTINPKTGFPVQHNLLSATVISHTCAKADAYATAFMVMGKDKTIEFIQYHPEENLEIYLIFSDEQGNYQTYMSNGMQKILQEF
jgi:thiamine biosynthesis lipoprotein